MNPRQPFFFDSALSLGDLGEHFAEATAFVLDNGEGYEPSVIITIASVIVKFGRHTQLLDLMPLLQSDKHEYARWRDMIAADWLKRREREWEREDAEVNNKFMEYP
jgi:hypothetical protein